MRLNPGFDYQVRDIAFEMSNGFCQCSKECILPVTEFHHKLSNSKVNAQLYPLFINSIFNCCPINHNCHLNKTPLPHISEREAKAYEEYLKLISPS